MAEFRSGAVCSGKGVDENRRRNGQRKCSLTGSDVARRLGVASPTSAPEPSATQLPWSSEQHLLLYGVH